MRQELFDESYRAELKRIELRSRRTVTSDLAGSYRSAFRGRGLQFSDLREYEPGDDVKHIHWKASARTGRVYVKSYEEERDLTVIAAIDISHSTRIGAKKTNLSRALEFGALLGLLAQQNRDAFGICLFGGTIHEYLPPRRSRHHLQRIFDSLIHSPSFDAPATDIANALRFISERARKRAIVFLISDLYGGTPFQEDLTKLASRHDVIVTLVQDEIEHSLPKVGLVRFRDPESGAEIIIDTNAASEVSGKRRVESLQKAAATAGAEFMVIKDSPLKPLAELMERRVSRFR